MSEHRERIGRMRRLRQRARAWWVRLGEWSGRFSPGPRARKGAVAGAWAAVVILMIWAGVTKLRTGWGGLFDGMVGLVLAALTLGAITLAGVLVLRVARRLPIWFTAAVAAALFTVGSFGFNWDTASLLGLVLVPALLGGAIAVATGPDFRRSRTAKRVSIGVLLAVASAATIGFFVWMGGKGTTEGIQEVALPTHRPVRQLDAGDPGAPGTYSVNTLFYGSGQDRRPEFGEGVALKTEPVDGKPFVPELEGWRARFRDGYWGFDRRAFPLNGRVWYPEGRGPFPLVLVVHGNHAMRDYSDPGYAYLGEHLAGRGFITVSVDENFLNGDWSANYEKENDARGWILLEHLRTWRRWNAEKGNPFFERVDLDRIALIGHSRGGEAVAVAAAFNRLTRYPDDATVEFDYGFNIRAVVAIAPIDGQYMPSDLSTPLADVNYLVLQGSHDADVSFFSGDRMYKRITFTGDDYRFKTSIYIYRANHGQFNTVWGDSDRGGTGRFLLNRKALLDGEAQRQVARVYIGAFLETVLHERQEYLPLFKDYRRGAAWLPETYYVNRFEDSETLFVCDYDEDIDVTTATLEGARLSASGLATWREEDIGFRSGRTLRQNQAVYLGWRAPEEEAEESGVEAPEAGGEGVVGEPPPAEYMVELPAALAARWRLGPQSLLVFSLSEADEEPKEPEGKEAEVSGEGEAAEAGAGREGVSGPAEREEKVESETEREGDEEKSEEPLDLTVEVEDSRGERAAVPLSAVARLLPQLRARFTRTKATEERYGSSSEPVLQSVAIPLALFQEINPAFSPKRISAIRFRFDRSEDGVIILDEIGFRRR